MDFFLDSLNNAGLGVHCVHFASTVVTPHFCNLLCRGGSAGAAWRGRGRGGGAMMGHIPWLVTRGRGSCRAEQEEEWCRGLDTAGPLLLSVPESAPHCGRTTLCLARLHGRATNQYRGRAASLWREPGPASNRFADHGTGQVGEESDGAAGHRRSCTAECVAIIGGRLDNCWWPVTTPTINIYAIPLKFQDSIKYR